MPSLNFLGALITLSKRVSQSVILHESLYSTGCQTIVHDLNVLSHLLAIKQANSVKFMWDFISTRTFKRFHIHFHWWPLQVLLTHAQAFTVAVHLKLEKI